MYSSNLARHTQHKEKPCSGTCILVATFVLYRELRDTWYSRLRGETCSSILSIGVKQNEIRAEAFKTATTGKKAIAAFVTINVTINVTTQYY